MNWFLSTCSIKSLFLPFVLFLIESWSISRPFSCNLAISNSWWRYYFFFIILRIMVWNCQLGKKYVGNLPNNDYTQILWFLWPLIIECCRKIYKIQIKLKRALFCKLQIHFVWKYHDLLICQDLKKNVNIWGIVVPQISFRWWKLRDK